MTLIIYMTKKGVGRIVMAASQSAEVMNLQIADFHHVGGHRSRCTNWRPLLDKQVGIHPMSLQPS